MKATMEFHGLEELKTNLEKMGISIKNIQAAFVAMDYRKAPHAHLVEYGARGGAMPANPFFRRGVQQSKVRAFNRVAWKVGSFLDRLAFKTNTTEIEDVLLEGAKIVKDEIQVFAPLVPTGNLRKGVVAKKFKKSRRR